MTSPHDDRAQAPAVFRDIAVEFGAVFAFARSRWTRHAQEVHPDLRGVGLMVLQTVARHGPLTATEVCQHLGIDKATISRQVAALRELGFVSVDGSLADRRAQLLSLSPAGVAAIDELRALAALDYEERFAGWSEADLETLRALLHRFNERA